MFKIAVCDDEQAICSYIEEVILEYQRESYLEIEVEVFYSGEDLCRVIDHQERFDLIFLDIEMKLINGIEVGKKIRQELDDYVTKIVFVSGTESYYKQLFNVQPLNFISKPIQPSRVTENIRLAMKLSNKLDGLFRYKKKHESYQIHVKDILYFESMGRQIRMVTIDGEDQFYGKLEEILAQVAKHQFMQIHKSYIVNYNQIMQFKYETVIVSDGDHLPISQSRRKDIRNFQMQYEKERLS
ncbi:MAG: LytTR family DNA-binding domain-containing protein [Candidatus Niameybacter stercoravium]|nr:LytTR family DNA-binding domain-containing protein [Candidatus Niameybacter stercoravium]